MNLSLGAAASSPLT